MIDTIKLYIRDIDHIDLGHIESNYTLTHLEVNDYHSDTTMIKNIQFKCDNNGIHLEGSAPKFIKKNNIETLKFHEIPEFVSTLSGAVGFDVSELTISRIDITDNIEVDYPPKTYKRYFGKCRYFKKIDHDHNGLQYINDTRSHTLYDKILEQTSKGIIVPKEYVDKKLLRYEYSIKRKRKEHLGEAITTLADLQVSENYLTIVDKWGTMFNQIEKISFEPSVSMPYVHGMKPNAYYALLGAQNNGGIERSMYDIDEWEDRGLITRRIGRTMKNNLNKYQNQYNQLRKSEVIDRKMELITKFQEKVNENKRMV